MSVSLASFCKRSENSRDLALGLVGGGISLAAGYGAFKGSVSLLRQWGAQVKPLGGLYRIHTFFGATTHPLVSSILKICLAFYVVVLSPVVEEWFFRGDFYNYQEMVTKKATEASRVYRVLCNGFLFGSLHGTLALFLGWGSLVVFSVMTTTGIVFSILREMTGNQNASTIAHCLNNGVVYCIALFS